MAQADLHFEFTRQPGNADLPLGRVPGGGQAAALSGDIVLPDVSVDGRIATVYVTEGDAALPEVVVEASAVYLVNAWRGPSSAIRADHQRSTRVHGSVSAISAPLIRRRAAPLGAWSMASAMERHGLVPWGVMQSLHVREEARWMDGDGRDAVAGMPWQVMVPEHAAARLLWCRALDLGQGIVRSSYLHPARKQSDPRQAWEKAVPRERAARHAYNPRPVRRRDELRMPWGDARDVIMLWPRQPIPRPPPPPRDCRDTDRTRLRLSAPYSASPDMAFICHGAGGGGVSGDPVIIPILRAYIVIHDIELKRLSDGLPIHASRMTMELDVDSWAWGFSATVLGRDALDAVRPSSSGEPVILSASIDGHVWHVLVEDWTENREFGRRGISIKGRGLSAMLAGPYEQPDSGVTMSPMTVQQVLNAHLPLGQGWALAWMQGTPDWLVPAGAWSWSGKAPIQAIHEAASSVGLTVVPAKAGKTLTIMPRYPVLPWDYDTATPDIVIPDAAILNIQFQQSIPTQANAVYVHGGDVGGVLARVKRMGTAGDRVAQTASSSLVTHADAARLLGARMLAAQHRQPEVRSITTTVGGPFALGDLAQLLRVEIDGLAVHGIINAVSIDASMSDKSVTVRQTLTIGEQTPNTWARFRRLLPVDPLLVGTIESVHADGTATVLMLGGGSLRVRGSGQPGQAVYVRAGQIEGLAPSMGQVEIEV